MLTNAGYDVPNRVVLLFTRIDEPRNVLRGLAETGLVLTDQRLFAWRQHGASGPLPAAAVDRILIDTCHQGDRHEIVIVPRQAVHPTIALTRRTQDLPSTLAFVAAIAQAAGTDPDVVVLGDELGSLRRFTFLALRPAQA